MEGQETVVTSTTPVVGAFASTLRRSNSKIREDRAQAISEDAQLIYRRAIEDMDVKIKQLSRERENMLDLSPTDANSLKLASDFNSGAFVKKDLEIATNLRNLKIQRELAVERYGYLFGVAFDTTAPAVATPA